MFNCIINSCLIKLVNRWLLYFMTSDIKVFMFYILGLLLMRLKTCSNVIKDIGYGQMFAHSSHRHEYPGNLGLLIIFWTVLFSRCSFFLSAQVWNYLGDYWLTPGSFSFRLFNSAHWKHWHSEQRGSPRNSIKRSTQVRKVSWSHF